MTQFHAARRQTFLELDQRDDSSRVHRIDGLTINQDDARRRIQRFNRPVSSHQEVMSIGKKERADETLHRALARHDEILQEHLDLEEELVVPLLLALSPQEFGEYYDTSIDELLTRLELRAQANIGQA